MAVAAALAGCGDGDDASDADLMSADPGRTPLSSSTSDKLADYSEEEVTAYREAVAAFKRNVRVDMRVFREGRATPAAQRALASVYTGDELEDEWEALRDMEAAGGYFTGSITVVWAKPMRVLLDDTDGTVDLRACVDRRDVRVFKRGEGELEWPDGSEREVFKITVDQDSDGFWRVADGEELGRC